MKYEKPRALKRGGVIALIRPAGKIEEQRIQQAADSLRAEGYFVVFYPQKTKAHSYFAASDQERAAEWMWAFTQPGIDCVWACRGGYGSQRIIPQLDVRALKKAQPRIFVGYSDLTFMHHWHLNVLGRVSFHGPLLGHLQKTDLRAALREIEALSSRPQKQVWSEARVIRGGQARGLLVGGNMSLLQSAGVAALPKTKMILALEDIHEDFYRLDRMIWNLIHAGYDQWVEGVLLGSFKNCGRKDHRVFPRSIWIESLKRLTQGPLLEACRFGHGLRRQRILPLGLSVQMRDREVQFEEGAVI
jgi:muramoyltetrapeptide carboxypeptidase